MRIVFCGTPQFAVPSLRHLLVEPGLEVLAVITQPDRPSGRGGNVTASPVKQVASEHGLAVLQPQNIKTPEAVRALRELAPEAVVLVAYGQIISVDLLSLPHFGWINLHPSLLPKYRGAAPIQWAIARGEQKTGVTTMQLDPGMDTGDILLQREVLVGPDETAPELSSRIAEAGAPLVAETLHALSSGKLIAKPQDHSSATYAPLLKKEDGRVDWSLSARAIYNRMRGFAPWPGAYTGFRGQTCHIWGRPLDAGAPGPSDAPSRIRVEEGGMRVACGQETWLELFFLQLEGRKRISTLEFLNGFRVGDGESFESPAASKDKA
jgi:methionyl-tRNA formyltransferase